MGSVRDGKRLEERMLGCERTICVGVRGDVARLDVDGRGTERRVQPPARPECAASAQRTAKSADGEAAQAPLTKDQAKELFRSVDEILAFASKDTKLPIEHSVKRKLITRDEVNKYLRREVRRGQGREADGAVGDCAEEVWPAGSRLSTCGRS